MPPDWTPKLIGIAGGTGSGKTTVAHRLIELVGTEQVALLAQDSYYRHHPELSPQQRAAINFDHPDSIEDELLVQHLKQLRDGIAIEQPQYDFFNHQRKTDSILVAAKHFIIVEGILIFVYPELRELFDLKIFVETPDDIRFIRRLQRDTQERGRDMSSVVDQYLTTVRPMHASFVAPSKEFADIIVPEGGQNSAAMQLLSNAVRGWLKE